MQKTLKEEIEVQGTGLHSGVDVSLKIKPAAPNFGIVFKRVDLPNQPEIKALYSNIVDTRNCSCLGDGNGNIVSTVEHLMSALAVRGIDNAIIDIDNSEAPIMDGSASEFYDILSKAELVEQNAKKKILRVLQKVEFQDDKGNIVSLEPSARQHIRFEIEFPSKVVGHQVFDEDITEQVFASEISCCRTFCEKYQVDYLKSLGLVKGGSLQNAVVLDGEKILNPEGFRVQNECVNHKVLDAIGDLYLSGHHIIGLLKANKTGHYHTNELLKILFSDEKNYKIEEL